MRVPTPIWPWRPGRQRIAAGDDRTLVRRATVTIAVLTAGAVAVVVAAVMLLTLYLTVREQRADARRIVRNAAADAEDTNDPPGGVTLLIQRTGDAPVASAGAPAELQGLDPATLSPGYGTVSFRNDHDYQVFVVDRDGARYVAALDLSFRARESDRLVGALVPAGLAGIAAAAAVGWLVARRAVRPLADALALQRRFVADASHELRTPLTILHTRAQMMRLRAGPDAPQREDLDHLIEDSRVLSEIVTDLLLSAELSHRPAASETVDLAALARTVVRSFSPTAQSAGVALEAETDSGEATTVAGVGAALRRAVSALVDNALSHTGSGGQVTVSVHRRDGWIELTVVDNGEGFDAADAAVLTQRFARGGNAEARGRRFGLGLALVREVVEAHRGVFTLDGQPGTGAAARIALPAAPSTASPQAPPI